VQEALKYDEFQVIQQSLFDSGGASYNIEDLKDQDRVFARNGAFRRNITKLYDYRCAFCKVRVVSQDGQNLVDGAHIKPFSEFRNDYFVNGLALCKNHHWAFDHGWFGISENYQIVIPENRLTEEPPKSSLKMEDFHAEEILLPNNQQYLPSLESLEWHRQHWQISA
jgi:putative restriction endonuclease